MRDHGLTGDESERFSGETSSLISGRDDGDDPAVHSEPSGNNYWHEES